MIKAKMTTAAMMEMMTRRRRISIGYRTYRTPRRFSKVQLLIVAITFIGALFFSLQLAQGAKAKVTVQVESVADGDTIQVRYSDGHSETIRLLGIDTPETHHPTKPVGCFGPEASNFTRGNLDGQSIQLEYDIERIDKYGRTLAYVYFGNVRFNDVLVREGYARILNISPNNKHSNELLMQEIQARKSNKGLWGACQSEN